MAQIEAILGVESKVSKAGKPFTITKVQVEGKQAEVFGNANVGDQGNLSYNDQFKKYEFKRAQSGVRSNTKEFKADPVKNASIERQVALKAAVDITVANLPLHKEQPKGSDQVAGVLAMASAFDQWLKGETNSPKVIKEGDVDEIPFSDDEIPTDIDLDNVDFEI